MRAMTIARALPDCFDRKVARLPNHGVLIVSTDLQGNFNDYEALKSIYFAEKAAGEAPVLGFVGDLVHGPSADLQLPGNWPDFLGTQYADESARLLLDLELFSRSERAFSLLGNHEHAHIGGPVVPKFYPDEAAVLDRSLGPEKERMHAFLRSFPLLAVGRCGVVLTHGAPGATEADLPAFESLSYEGYRHHRLRDMHKVDTLGGLLWSRSATSAQAQAFLKATSFDTKPNAFVAFGHDVVHEGWERAGADQICFSTSYGLFDRDKVYLRLDLSHRYQSALDLRPGVEILPLYPDARPEAR